MTEVKYKFSKSYVLKTTMRHMRKSIDISIGKSVERFKDFDRDVESGNEIMETLSVLHELRNQLDEFQEQNKELFKGK